MEAETWDQILGLKQSHCPEDKWPLRKVCGLDNSVYGCPFPYCDTLALQLCKRMSLIFKKHTPQCVEVMKQLPQLSSPMIQRISIQRQKGPGREGGGAGEGEGEERRE